MAVEPARNELKIYISVDMEGITGIVNRDQVTRGEIDYERARRLMTREANAAVKGALDAGATYVLVNDSQCRSFFYRVIKQRAIKRRRFSAIASRPLP